MGARGDAPSDQGARRGGRTLAVGILHVEEEGATRIVDGNWRLKGKRSKRITEGSRLILESTFSASQFENKVSAEGAGKSRGCCLWVAVVE